MVSSTIKQNKYNYMLIVAGATIVGAIVVIFAVIFPLINYSKKVTATFDEKASYQKKLTEKKENLDRLNSKSDQLKVDADKISAALPETKDVGRLYIQLEELVKNSGGSIKSVSENTYGSSTQTSANIKNVNKVSYVVPFDISDYYKLKNIFTDSENSLRLMNIDGLDITYADGGRFSVILTMTTYTRN